MEFFNQLCQTIAFDMMMTIFVQGQTVADWMMWNIDDNNEVYDNSVKVRRIQIRP